MTTETTPEPFEGPGEPAVGGQPPEPTPAAPARRSGGLLRHHDFRLLWRGATISKGGSAVTTVALPLVAGGARAARPVAIGLLEAAASVPVLLVGRPGGAWV